MFSFVRRYPFLRRLIIAAFALPLMFAGGSFIGSLAQQQSVGVVGELEIPRNEFNVYFQNYMEEYRRRYGVEEITEPVAEQIIGEVQRSLGTRYLIESAIHQMGIDAPDAVVADAIRDNPEFHNEAGVFQLALYEDLVTNRRYYEKQVRSDQNRLPLQFVMASYHHPRIRDTLAQFRRQTRVVDEAAVPLTAIDSDLTVSVSEQEINLYYQRNNADYAFDELGVFEYFTIALDDYVDADLAVDDAAIEELYEDYLTEQQIYERRRVSHIYTSDSDTADALYERLLDADADTFAAAAREASEDPGTAAAGGELGIFASGDLPEPMEAAVFAAEVGEVSAPVAVDGGYSILRVDEIINEGARPLEDMRTELARQYRRDAALGQFDDVVQELNDLAPLELGNLQPLAALVSANISTVQISNQDISENPKPFDDATVLLDVFDSYVVEESENSLGIPLSDDEDVFLYTRARQYRPAGVEPLEVVGGEIAGKLRAEKILDIVRAEDDILAPILATLAWTATHTINLANDTADADSGDSGDTASESADDEANALDDETVNLIFVTDLSDGLPANNYQAQEDAIRVFRTREIIDQDAQLDDYNVIDQLTENLASQLAFDAYLNLLRDQYEIQFDELQNPLTHYGGGQPAGGG